jgi:hypothetical protein
LVAKTRVLAGLQLGYAVVGEPRHAAPYDHVAVPDRELAHGVATLQPAELEDCGQPSDAETIGCA